MASAPSTPCEDRSAGAAAPAAIGTPDVGAFRSIPLTMKSGVVWPSPSPLEVNGAKAYVANLPRDTDGPGRRGHWSQ